MKGILICTLVVALFTCSWACDSQKNSMSGTTKVNSSSGIVPAAHGGETETALTKEKTMSDKRDIVDTAINAGSFKTLVTAVQAAELVATLKGAGPFTVFAPNDEAFGKIPSEALNGLLKDKSGLSSVLTYHVIAGEVMAADVVKLDGKKVKTVNGQEVTIHVKDGSVYINNAKVIATDVKASNGIIHVLDTVIMPK